MALWQDRPRSGLAAEREAYLDKLSAALAHTDWQLLGYALMNNHVHLGLLGRELHEIAAALCLSNSAASELAKQGHRVADAAREVAQQLLEQPEPGATSLSPPLQG